MSQCAFPGMKHLEELTTQHGPLWSELYIRIVHLIKRHPIEECIQNMNALHDHIHRDPVFLREYKSDFLSSEEDTPLVSYARSLKQYKHMMILEQQKLTPLLHALSMVKPEELEYLLPSVQEKVDAYVQTKKRVCDSVFRLFEYVVEYEQLQKIMHPASRPSYDPLPVEEVHSPHPLPQEVLLAPYTPAPDLRPSPLPFQVESP